MGDVTFEPFGENDMPTSISEAMRNAGIRPQTQNLQTQTHPAAQPQQAAPVQPAAVEQAQEIAPVVEQSEQVFSAQLAENIEAKAAPQVEDLQIPPVITAPEPAVNAVANKEPVMNTASFVPQHAEQQVVFFITLDASRSLADLDRDGINTEDLAKVVIEKGGETIAVDMTSPFGKYSTAIELNGAEVTVECKGILRRFLPGMLATANKWMQANPVFIGDEISFADKQRAIANVMIESVRRAAPSPEANFGLPTIPAVTVNGWNVFDADKNTNTIYINVIAPAFNLTGASRKRASYIARAISSLNSIAAAAEFSDAVYVGVLLDSQALYADDDVVELAQALRDSGFDPISRLDAALFPWADVDKMFTNVSDLLVQRPLAMAPAPVADAETK